jgi:hypothetical protein
VNDWTGQAMPKPSEVGVAIRSRGRRRSIGRWRTVMEATISRWPARPPAAAPGTEAARRTPSASDTRGRDGRCRPALRQRRAFRQSRVSRRQQRPVATTDRLGGMLSRDNGCRCLRDACKQQRMLFDECDHRSAGSGASASPRSRSRERAGAGDCSCRRRRSRPTRASAIRRRSASRRC